MGTGCHWRIQEEGEGEGICPYAPNPDFSPTVLLKNVLFMILDPLSPLPRPLACIRHCQLLTLLNSFVGWNGP